MRDELAPRILPVVLTNVTTTYPYHVTHVATQNDPPSEPAIAHPSFGNSFDWHSSVHSHWTAVRLIEHFASHRATKATALERLAAAVAGHLHQDKIAVETTYLQRHPSFERPYGWAWALLLASAASGLDAMAAWVAQAAMAWLDVLPEPVRHGVHSNTAFALGLMHDAARALDFDELRGAIESRSRMWFYNDTAWPQRWERSGHDFLSPGLAEADLLRRILSPDDFAAWWQAFLPALASDAPILSPVGVPDVADGQIVHLHGLNLSRAGALARIAAALGDVTLLDRAKRLYAASAGKAVSGDYHATHWLATFAWDAATSIDAFR